MTKIEQNVSFIPYRWILYVSICSGCGMNETFIETTEQTKLYIAIFFSFWNSFHFGLLNIIVYNIN